MVLKVSINTCFLVINSLNTKKRKEIGKENSREEVFMAFDTAMNYKNSHRPPYLPLRRIESFYNGADKSEKVLNLPPYSSEL